MKAWLPYVVAALVGIGVVWFLFRAPTATPPDPATDAGGTKAPERTVVTLPSGEPAPGDQGMTANATGNPSPDHVILPKDPNRETTPAEIEHQQKLARPFNKHHDLVASFWGQAARYAIAEGKQDLAREMSRMDDFLGAQGRLADDEAEFANALTQELALVEKVRGAGLSNPEIPGMMTYVEAVTTAAQAGQDPTTVRKPTLAELQGGTYRLP